MFYSYCELITELWFFFQMLEGDIWKVLDSTQGKYWPLTTDSANWFHFKWSQEQFHTVQLSTLTRNWSFKIWSLTLLVWVDSQDFRTRRILRLSCEVSIFYRWETETQRVHLLHIISLVNSSNGQVFLSPYLPIWSFHSPILYILILRFKLCLKFRCSVIGQRFQVVIIVDLTWFSINLIWS